MQARQLKRLKERAESEGKTLQEIAESRADSLQDLEKVFFFFMAIKRARLGTTAHFCEVVVLRLRTVQKIRCRAKMAHISQSRPDSGLGFKAHVFKTFEVVHSSLGIGSTCSPGEFIRTSIVDKYSGSKKEFLHTWIISVMPKQHLVQIGRIDGLTEYS